MSAGNNPPLQSATNGQRIEPRPSVDQLRPAQPTPKPEKPLAQPALARAAQPPKTQPPKVAATETPPTVDESVPPTEPASTAAGTPPVRRVGRSLLRIVLLLVVPAVVAVTGLYFYVKGGRFIDTENAYVKSDIIAVSSDIDGRVTQVGVHDHQRVEAGALLFVLDSAPLTLALAKAEAELDIVAAEVESMRADYREVLGQATEARERVSFFERQLERQKKLKARGMGRAEQFDEAQHNVNLARQQVRVLEEKGRRTLASLGGDAKIATEAHPRYLRAQAVRDWAKVDLGKTVIRAPSAGIVSNMKLQIGEYVNDGQPIFSIIGTETLWVEANLKETQLTHVSEGLTATLVADAYPDYEWQASVKAIATGNRSGVCTVTAAERHRQLGKGGTASAGTARN